eukprot:scaffold253916_cov19-Tisochrysis_lutea.AAC.1
MERAENVRSMLDLKPIELFAVLRKNPGIFLLDSAETRARYNAIHKVGVLHGKRAYDVRPSARAGKGDAISAFPDLALRVCSGCKNCQWMQVGLMEFGLWPTTVVHFSRDAVRTMVRKLPLLLSWETENLERKIDDMRQLAYTRCAHWLRWSAIEHLSTDTVHWKLTGPEHSQIALILTARTE